MIREPRSVCPINRAVEILGDHWSMIVLREMIFAGGRHFGEFQQVEEGIAPNILSSRLKDLEEAGLITKQPAPRGHRVTYSLTEAGIQTVPVLIALGIWGSYRFGRPDDAPVEWDRFDELVNGGPAAAQLLMDRLRRQHL